MPRMIKSPLRAELRAEAADTRWKTRAGKEIDIKDMSDEHLLNSFSLCMRKLEFYRTKATALNVELKARDEAKQALARTVPTAIGEQLQNVQVNQ